MPVRQPRRGAPRRDPNQFAKDPKEAKTTTPTGDIPTSDWLKADIQAWLDERGVEYPSSATKTDLLELV